MMNSKIELTEYVIQRRRFTTMDCIFFKRKKLPKILKLLEGADDFKISVSIYNGQIKLYEKIFTLGEFLYYPSIDYTLQPNINYTFFLNI